MRDIWAEQLKWVDSEEPFMLARVIRTWRSAPRKKWCRNANWKRNGQRFAAKSGRFCQRRLY